MICKGVALIKNKKFVIYTPFLHYAGETHLPLLKKNLV